MLLLQNLIKKLAKLFIQDVPKFGWSRETLLQCAKKQRISTSVLEAIENGWIEKLPEKAYLSSMLSLLENSLNLPKGSLDGVLQETRLPTGQTSWLTFIPSQIEIFTTWN